MLLRLRAGVHLARIAGNDRGALGDAPFRALDRALTRSVPDELFFDLRDAAGASSAVRDAWTSWFQANRRRLARVVILTSSRFIHLTVEIAKLFSRTGELIQIYSDQLRFEQAIAVASGAPVTLPPSSLVAPLPAPLPRPVEIVRERLSDRRVRLSSPHASWLFEKLRPGVLLVTVTGLDQGEFGTRTLDEVDSAVGHVPLALFIDARNSPSTSVATSEAWTQWLSSHRAAVRGVLVLVSTPSLRLTLAIAGHRSRTGDLLRVTDDAGELAAAVAVAAPGFELL